MQGLLVRSRWNVGPRRRLDGCAEPILFGPSDLDICKLLTADAPIRRPWAYPFLPTSYFAPLLQRGSKSVPKRIRKLTDWGYLSKPEQPRTNSREIVYSIAKAGLDALRDHGFAVIRRPHRQLAHDLLASIVAASFELASMTRADTLIDPNSGVGQLDIVPDWPPFRFVTRHASRIVFIEADLGTETLDGPGATTIAGKLDRYLSLIFRQLTGRPLFLFVTTRPSRAESMVELLKRVIDRNGYPHDYAEPFAFTHIPYDRFVSRIPKLTDWAVSQPYQRAGFPPLRLLAP